MTMLKIRPGRRLAAALLAMCMLSGSALPLAAKTSRPKPALSRSTRQTQPAKTEVKADEAKTQRKDGQLFAVVIGPGPAWKKGQPLRKSSRDGHWRYWQGLHDKGLVESAGPVGQDTGFALLRARNQREANALLAGDPAIKAGRFRAVARPYAETIGN